MDRKLLEEFWQEALDMVRESIRITKSAGLQNEQRMLDFIDELNKLSIEF